MVHVLAILLPDLQNFQLLSDHIHYLWNWKNKRKGSLTLSIMSTLGDGGWQFLEEISLDCDKAEETNLNDGCSQHSPNRLLAFLVSLGILIQNLQAVAMISLNLLMVICGKVELNQLHPPKLVNFREMFHHFNKRSDGSLIVFWTVLDMSKL